MFLRRRHDSKTLEASFGSPFSSANDNLDSSTEGLLSPTANGKPKILTEFIDDRAQIFGRHDRLILKKRSTDIKEMIERHDNKGNSESHGDAKI